MRPRTTAKSAAVTPQEMTISQLESEMERTHKAGDGALFKILVSEYQKRRG
jgi:hypothetical protein